MTSPILIVTAVEAERKAMEEGLSTSITSDVHVIAAGAGPASAAAVTAATLAKQSYRLVINAGIGGGFPDQAEVGSLVLATEIIAADLGSETAEGFRSVDELGFGKSRVSVDHGLVERWAHVLQGQETKVHTGPILTVSTTTGSKSMADELQKRVPGATAESMEGFGVGTAAAHFGVPVVEIRAISNVVGPRDRDAWRIPDALKALTLASSKLSEVL
ncbi:futalosine hydrolase [Paenibacillus sp. Marseille-Q4541]|uniref:futalosine hydrolase n=1 Tax=Paenibacillus sp. Marseille-Q4541 TaxID=2831522 RepID=UPI001BA5A458|nr:futalosine hydrolase [Paenibacillus sp. Marseille-Q4541]